MILVITTYQKSKEEIDKYLPEHSAHLEKYYLEKKVIFSGRRNPRIGGVILFNVEDQKEAWEIIERDPFKKHGIADYHLIDFIPTKFDKEFEVFLKK